MLTVTSRQAPTLYCKEGAAEGGTDDWGEVVTR